MTVSQRSSNFGQFELPSPQLPQPKQQLLLKGGSTFDAQNNDYANVQQHPNLFSNREERKNTRFKKNPSNERGYGKQKYASQKSSSLSSTNNTMINSNGPAASPMPHSLLEKEIRQIMNQS